MKRPKVLLIIESCNPSWSSVPLVGYRFFLAASKVADVTLVTHARNKEALLEQHSKDTIHFIEPKAFERSYYKAVKRLTTFKGRVVWPLYHALFYPIYYFFNREVGEHYRDRIAQKEYDIVHALTPMMPRYPYEISKHCSKEETPFILGPVNGGVPFPPGFKQRGRREFSQFNFFRSIGRAIIPNYHKTYQSADQILSGSEYTLQWIAEALNISHDKLTLFFENGVQDDFFVSPENARRFTPDKPLNIVFSGRLVPYKGVDMLIRAIAELCEKGEMVHLTIVGDGSEMQSLQSLVNSLNIQDHITFTGWVTQQETAQYYMAADVFGFPSVREFGGAVVMEAMACGLPCVVVNNGGIGEYVDETCGFKIEPENEQFVIDGLVSSFKAYIEQTELLEEHSLSAISKAKRFSWSEKANTLDTIYRQYCKYEK